MTLTDAQKALLNDVQEWLIGTEELMNRLEVFAKDNCPAFAAAKDGNDSENKLEYTTVYEAYQQLFEAELEAFLASKGHSNEAFVSACSASAGSQGSDDVGVTDFIVAMTDYEEFKRLMVFSFHSKGA